MSLGGSSRRGRCPRPIPSASLRLVAARKRTRTGLRCAVAVAGAPVGLANAYLVSLTVAALVRPARPVRDRRRGADGYHFAVLVPAHDEESSIGATVDSVVAQRPAGLVSVHVVADNCTDATAAVARRHGAQVYERWAPDEPGKGPALAWLVAGLAGQDDWPDAFVIIDADTVMAPDFLVHMDAAVGEGGVAWQGYYTVRDPGTSPSTALRSGALALRHYVRPLGRMALGGSCGLFGNGMVFRSELLRDRRFSAHLVEDVEFQLDLLLDGELVRFVPDAVVAAEMPATLDAARTQNERWERGRLDVARRYVPELARRALRGGPASRAAHVDAVADQLTPPLSVVAAGSVAAALAATGLSRGGGRAARLQALLAWVSVAGLAFHVLGGFRLARVPKAVYQAMFHAPRLVAWKLGLWLRMVAGRREVAWTRTRRNEEGAASSPAP
jgi:1,2-diacylglycerol 3-beta-glucosyltransferase